MELQFFLVQQNINSYAEIEQLNSIQQEQLLVRLKSYYGKKTALKKAFTNRCVADFLQIVAVDNLDEVLYDFWKINGDSGGAFFANTAKEAGVVLIQGGFNIQLKFEKNPDAQVLLEQLADAKVLVKKDLHLLFNEKDEVDDFVSMNTQPINIDQWVVFLKNKLVSEQFIDKYEANFDWDCWDIIYQRVQFSEAFINKFSKKINWHLVSEYQKLSEQFIREHQQVVNWKEISSSQTLSEDFIREFQNNVNWDNISSCQQLSESFILEFEDSISWDDISWAHPLSIDFIRKFQDRLVWETLCTHQKFTDESIREFLPKFDSSCWNNLSQHANMSIAFIKEFKSRLSWNNLSMNCNLTEEHLSVFKDKIHWNALIVFGRGLSEELLIQYSDYISKADKYPDSPESLWRRVLRSEKKFPISDSFRKDLKKKIKELK